MRKNAEKKTSSDVPRGRVTIRMVADRAGVSSAAVYAALNRNPRSNIGISEEKRKSIQKVIAELGYIPNNSARMLVSGRSSNIGVLLNTIDDISRTLFLRNCKLQVRLDRTGKVILYAAASWSFRRHYPESWQWELKRPLSTLWPVDP